MSNATIRREGKSSRSSAQRPRGRRSSKPKSGLDKLIDRLPFGRETLSKLLTLLVAVLLLIAAGMVASFFGLPAMAAKEAAGVAARAGFQVAKVEVQGVRRMDEMPVYNLALDEIDRSMLSVDLAALRARVMTLGWVKDARVTRRLPDTLVIDVVERDPVAVWQHEGKLSLIDVDGVVLQSLDGRAMPDLPLVVGPDANRETRALQSLLDAAPALKPLLSGATWVGKRRWDLRFQSGETLSLPEGPSVAAAALMKFAQMDGVNRLLGRGLVRFDMRDPTRFVLRLPSDSKSPAASDAKTAKDGDDDKATSDKSKKAPEAKTNKPASGAVGEG